MKISIELNEDLEEDELIIRCRELTDTVSRIQKSVTEITGKAQSIALYKDDVEYYIPLSSLLFFETSDAIVCAHTADESYLTKHKLYELEEILPGYFQRVSKSTILNINEIYSVTRNLTASSVVQFAGTHKKVYVSRNYYKELKNKLEEKRGIYER